MTISDKDILDVTPSPLNRAENLYVPRHRCGTE